MLKSAPSFEVYHTNDGVQDGDSSGHEDLVERKVEEALTRTVTIEDSIDGVGNSEFSFGQKDMGLIEEELREGEEDEDEDEDDDGRRSPPMYLATGLGIDVPSIGQGGEVVDLSLPNFDDAEDAEEFYKRILQEYPCHPMILKKYAQLLQSKGELHGAEAYYHRATEADPRDGEALLQYAKLIWELHRDRDRASSYFERASQAAPHDGNVLSAYACFLWEIDDDKEVNVTQHIEAEEEIPCKLDHGENSEEYHRRMVEENPNNPEILRNYAQFLYQSQGDLQGAEEYYKRAIQADPSDSEILLEYAKLVWELHRNYVKALSYYELAVQAAPENSNILAAYASFLWEAGHDHDEEDRDARQDHSPASHLHEGVVTTN